MLKALSNNVSNLDIIRTLVVANTTIERPVVQGDVGRIDFEGKWQPTYHVAELERISSAFPDLVFTFDHAEKGKRVLGRIMAQAGRCWSPSAKKMQVITSKPGFQALIERSG